MRGRCPVGRGLVPRWEHTATGRKAPPHGIVAIRVRPSRGPVALPGEAFLLPGPRGPKKTVRAATWPTAAVPEDHASGFRSRSPGTFTNRSSRVHSSVAPPSMAHKAIWRSNTRGPRTFRSAAVCTSRAANPGPAPVRVHEQIRIDLDHASDLRESCIAARSATSTPGGSPPETVTHLIATRRCRPRLRASGRRRSSARSPRRTSSRSGRRISAARFFAASTRSSGSSTVTFIQKP